LRYLVLSDIHANLEALTEVLDDAGRRTWDRCLALGDLVGYGADPNPVLDRLREFSPDQVIRGNHDKVVSGITDGSYFNPLALASAQWTREVIRPDNRRWLEELPQGPVPASADPDVLLSHGSPIDEEAYILGLEDAWDTFLRTSFGVCLFGHTHYPMVIGHGEPTLDIIAPPSPEGGAVELSPSGRYLVNPGSIGQPRDGNPRASYIILDTGAHRVEFFRVSYPVEETMAKIMEAGLPSPLAARLARGE
jgi:diadenosine tetraphosphatase ApaH/serine/threonine PP2A family protein phosphatase